MCSKALNVNDVSLRATFGCPAVPMSPPQPQVVKLIRGTAFHNFCHTTHLITILICMALKPSLACTVIRDLQHKPQSAWLAGQNLPPSALARGPGQPAADDGAHLGLMLQWLTLLLKARALLGWRASIDRCRLAQSLNASPVASLPSMLVIPNAGQIRFLLC
jgi:hypothetical protein